MSIKGGYTIIDFHGVDPSGKTFEGIYNQIVNVNRKQCIVSGLKGSTGEVMDDFSAIFSGQHDGSVSCVIGMEWQNATTIKADYLIVQSSDRVMIQSATVSAGGGGGSGPKLLRFDNIAVTPSPGTTLGAAIDMAESVGITGEFIIKCYYEPSAPGSYRHVIPVIFSHDEVMSGLNERTSYYTDSGTWSAGASWVLNNGQLSVNGSIGGCTVYVEIWPTKTTHQMNTMSVKSRKAVKK